MSKQTATIENAQVVGNRLFGQVYNHPTLPDGADIQTSSIKSQDSMTVETKNTIYTVKSWYNTTTGVDLNV